MTHPHRGHILTFKLKKSLEISMHLGGKDINFGFGGWGGILILCKIKIYTPVISFPLPILDIETRIGVSRAKKGPALQPCQNQSV